MRTATDTQFIMAGGWLLFLWVTFSLDLGGEIRSLFFRSSVIVFCCYSFQVVSAVCLNHRLKRLNRIPGVFSLNIVLS